jgi:benzoyl-CoA reductase/2-hydroxyglutaryl-CoA dehydratase subunit BcrC/BadD/HgdB
LKPDELHSNGSYFPPLAAAKFIGARMEPFEIMQRYYTQRELAALEWKGKGGKIVGYFCNDVPEELILAAGFFPFRLSGDPWSGTEETDKYTSPVYEGFVRSMLNLLLTGKYDFLDFLIIPHSRDAIEALYPILRGVKQVKPGLKIPELYLFDILHTRFWLSGQYLYGKVCEFKKKLEEWSGKEITNESIVNAIAVCNENRTLLKRIAALRTEEPPRVSGTEALQIIGASMFMLKEEHNQLLRQYLDGTGGLPARDEVRLFVEASPLDNLQLYELVESFGVTIVGEDNCWGNRYSDNPVDTALDPINALTERYQLKSPCPRMHPLERRVEYCLQSVGDAKARGVLFYILEHDYSQTWEYPDEKKALDGKNIPALCLKNQKYLLSESDKKIIGTEVKRFVETIGSKSTTTKAP